MVPVLLGLNKYIKDYYFTSNLIVGSLGGLIMAAIWGILKQKNVKSGLKLVFYDEYLWESFVIAFLSSIVFSLGLSCIYFLIENNQPKKKVSCEDKEIIVYSKIN